MIQRLSKTLSLFGPFLGLVFVYCLFLLITSLMSTDDYNIFDRFRSLYNTKTILTQTVIIGIGSLGMTLVIISAGIDLSVGSIVALVTVVTALVLKHGIPDDATTGGVVLPLVAAIAGIAAGALCGFVNGCLISFLRIVPFIVTLGMMQIARGLAKLFAKSTTVEVRQIDAEAIWLNGLMRVPRLQEYVALPDEGFWSAPTQWLGDASTNAVIMFSNVFAANSAGVWLMALLLATMFIVLRYTVFGRHVFAVGSNEATARLCGVNVPMTRVWIYTLCGALMGVAGVMQFSRLTLGSPTAGIAMELDIIAAVVIGGGSLSGGQGSVIGSLVGALIIVVLRNGCTMVGADNYVQNIIIGAIIIAAVALDRLKHRREA